MPRAVALLAAVLVVVAGVLLRADPVNGPGTAKAWVRAVNEGDWKTACGLLESPPRDCAGELRRRHGGRRHKLLPANGYKSGERATDNRTFFAMLADDESLLSFEVIRKGDAEKVRQVTFFEPPVERDPAG